MYNPKWDGVKSKGRRFVPNSQPIGVLTTVGTILQVTLYRGSSDNRTFGSHSDSSEKSRVRFQ